MLYHACSWNRNQSVAVSLAHHVAAYQREYPDTPIILIGHSGGGAMVVVALEQLPPGYRVHQAILLAPDLDPKHSLGVAMDHTLCGIDVFRSHFDLLVLGVGTSLVGTLDRAHSPAAGLVGFRQPSGLDERSRFLYSAKLREHDYRVEMVLTGHTGGHFTCTTPAFVDRYVSPVIR
jgi:pimeloyl-ACP methyl ester carboxylesterase